MRRLLLLLLPLALASKTSFSQVYLEPFAGYQNDINNKNFNLLNTGLQLTFKKGRRYELMVQVQKSWSFSNHSYDSSFTANPGLPLYAPAAKKLNPYTITAAIGNRIKLTGGRSNNSLFVKIYTGFTYQRIAVSYQYDKANYTILNPDQSVSEGGLYLSGGLEYMRQLKTGRLFCEVNISTPPLTGKLNYPYSFNLLAPLSFNIGYSIPLKKK